MTGCERVGRGLELQRDVDRLVDRHRLGVGAAGPVGQVEQAAGDERAGAVGEDVLQLGREEGDRRAGAEPDRQRRVADDLQRLVDGPVVGQRPRVVGPLVLRLTPRQAAGARDPRAGPGVGPHVQPVVPGALDGQRPGLGPVDRPARLGPPATGVLGQVRLGPGGVAHEQAHGSVGVDAVVLVPQPVAEPTDHLGDEVDVGSRQRGLRRHVAPRPHQQGLGCLQRGEGAEGVVAVAVGPPTDQQRGATDAPVVGPQRAVAPVRAVSLLSQPCQQPRFHVTRPGGPTPPASRRRTPRGPAAARSSASCSGSSPRGRWPAARRPCSGRRRCSGRRWRRWRRWRGAPAAARRPSGWS